MNYKKRSGFTLVEILISVVLLTLIVTYLYNSISILKISNTALLKNAQRSEKRDLIFNLLFRDIFQAKDIKIINTQNKNFDILNLSTKNSLHDLSMPNVTYVVVKNDKKLIRIESPYNIKLPIPYESKYLFYADEIAKNIDFFKIYKKQSNNKKDANNTIKKDQNKTKNTSNILIAIKIKEKSPIFFEIMR